MFEGKGLPYYRRPSESDYRAAVSKIISTIMADEGLCPRELGEKIGVCAKTIKNAKAGNCSLSAVALGNIRWKFGPESVRPWDDICDQNYSEPETVTDRFDHVLDEFLRLRRAVGA